MSIIQNKCLIFVVLVLVSCSSRNDNCLSLNDSICSKWQADSNGCLQYRYRLVKKGIINKKTLVGVDFKCIRKKFGDPNASKINNEGAIYIYYITCKVIPHFTFHNRRIPTRVDTEAYLFLVTVNKNDVVTHTNFIIP